MSNITLSKVKTFLTKMNHKSDEFADLVHLVTGRYYKFDNPTEYQKAGEMLNMILHKGEPRELVILVNTFAQIFQVINKHQTINKQQFGYDDQIIYVTISNSPEASDKLMSSMLNVVADKARQGGHEI